MHDVRTCTCTCAMYVHVRIHALCVCLYVHLYIVPKCPNLSISLTQSLPPSSPPLIPSLHPTLLFPSISLPPPPPPPPPHLLPPPPLSPVKLKTTLTSPILISLRECLSLASNTTQAQRNSSQKSLTLSPLALQQRYKCTCRSKAKWCVPCVLGDFHFYI